MERVDAVAIVGDIAYQTLAHRTSAEQLVDALLDVLRLSSYRDLSFATRLNFDATCVLLTSAYFQEVGDRIRFLRNLQRHVSYDQLIVLSVNVHLTNNGVAYLAMPSLEQGVELVRCPGSVLHRGEFVWWYSCRMVRFGFGL